MTPTSATATATAVHHTLGKLLLCAAAMLPVAAAQASPVPRDVFFDGQGSLTYDAGSGVGAWLGTLDESPFPVVAVPLHFLSYVSFLFNSSTGHLSGSFEFTDAADLATTLVGDISGDLLQGSFASGGQLGLDFNINGGTGRYNRAFGFGISLFDFLAPVGGFSDYREAGVMQFSVPEPGTLALLATALLAAGLSRRKTLPLN